MGPQPKPSPGRRIVTLLTNRAVRSVAFGLPRVTTLNNARTAILDLERMDAPYLDKLNSQQRAAAGAPLETPLLIIAGAGTGKTNTLAHRVAHLIHTGTSPARILLLTFTRRAAAH